MENSVATAKVREYLAEVSAQWKTGQATEHSYRPALKTLLEGLLTKVIVINEPAHIKCGAPDYILRDKRTALHLGFIEAKDIGDGDLDGNGVHKEQFNRYKNSLENLCFTDYLDFHFYENGEFKDKVRIADVCGTKLVPAAESDIEKFVGMIEHFGAAKAQKVTSPIRLAKLMAGKARLLAQAIKEFLKDDTEKTSMLGAQMKVFRDILIHDISEETFADVYAQTITYGMFAARLHDTTPEDFSREEAARLIPRTNPFLKQMFNYIALDTNDTVEWVVDDLVTLFAATDVGGLMKDYGKDTAQTDPLLHFYEDFLAAYNPELRKARGVWYTPQPVVSFIVRSVDKILESEFGLMGGLANNEKAKFKVVNDNKAKKSDKDFIEREMHRVQILDPATGTGTFLAEVVKQIHSKFAAMQGMWQSYVSEHLLPRLNGFEILMASYAMAHLKLDMLLAETGYKHDTNERLRVFLTNSLVEYDKEVGQLFAQALSREAEEANFLKRDCPVMVVIGNPPYSGVSSNNGKWIVDLVGEYRKEPVTELPLNEKKNWLNDDYVKFIRFGQHRIDLNGTGIVAFITNHGFIDNPTFRGMRWSLLKSFDSIYVLDLHGNVKKKEKCADGSKDENVFDIQQGVCITFFIKTGKKAANEIGKVYHADIKGSREVKYTFLEGHSIGNVEYKQVDLSAPFYCFIPQNNEGRAEYDNGFAVNELLDVFSTGVQSSRDSIAVSSTKDELLGRFKIVGDLTVPSERMRLEFFGENKGGQYQAGDSYFWNFDDARKAVACLNHEEYIEGYAYRPFDDKFIYYSDKIVHRPRAKVFNNLYKKDNLAFIIGRQGQAVGDMQWNVVYATDKIVDLNIFYRGGGCTFPLYLYADNMGRLEKTPNLNKEIWAKINAAAGCETTPEEVFYYIYAVLHTPSYREKYKEFLKVDFPRIPYPTNGEEFKRLADIGRQLVEVHLLKAPQVKNMFSPVATFPAAGTNRVDAIKYEDGKVYISKEQYFDNVPPEAWEFFIGGYQPAQKWLKDRKGRTLSADDVMHYKSIIIALLETSRLMGIL